MLTIIISSLIGRYSCFQAVVTFLVMCNLSAIRDTRKRGESTSRPLSRALIKKAESQTDIISLIYTRNTSGYCFMSKALHLAQGQIR